MLSFFLLFPKESELIELRETIEMLKAQNSAAQAAIQGALNGPDHTHKGMMFCFFFSVEARMDLFSKEVLDYLVSLWKNSVCARL